MKKSSKRTKANDLKVQLGKLYPISDAIKILKECTSAKFDETVDIAVNLGIDIRKSDQTVRGATVLPHGTGKTVRVAVFAQGDNAKAATQAGADIVGFDDLAAKVKAGEMDFDVVIATPDAMRVVGQLGQILGPRGLMPNPKVGTVTNDVTTAVKNAKGGRVQFRADKAGVVHCLVGKISFDATAIKENVLALMTEIRRAKPNAAKGIYLRKLTMTTTMGPGLVIDLTSLEG